MAVNLQSIKVYCRLKPLKKNDISVKYEIINDVVSGIDVLDLKYQSSRNSHHNKYQYHGVFKENISQSLIFDIVAVPILDKFLSGMNCTIFTYGQTCSGKTHTMYGSKEDQGIIPRTFEYLFKCTKDHPNYKYSLEYIEIYNEEVYDLLAVKNKKHLLLNKINKNIKFNNKVKFSIRPNGDLEYKNLNNTQIINVSDALQHIESGNLRKKISSTSLNLQSSRSHCICIVTLLKMKGGPVTKLNLVDLAGSERISNSENNEKTLIESRSINSSLHHLNHVINVLANPKIHVPYRNSTITSVLKGSLGAECATAMIATVVLNQQCIGESMSTCRFSKAVSVIKRSLKDTPKTKSPSKLLLLRDKVKTLEIQKLTWEKEKEVLIKKHNELVNILSNEEEKEQERLSDDFWCKIIENQIDLENKNTNTKNNKDLMITSIENHEELKVDGINANVECDIHDGRPERDDYAMGDCKVKISGVDVKSPPVKEFGDGTNDNLKMAKVDGIVENLTSDLSGNELRPNFKIVDGNNNVSAVHVMAPCVVHRGVETDDNTITQSETIDNNMVMMLENSEIYRLANVFLKHCKLIVLIIIIISMFKPQRLIWNKQLDADTVNANSAIFNTLKYLKPGFSIDSIMPEWLKSHWYPVQLCPDGGSLQTHCCCGQCLWICIKPINDRTNEKIISSFCDCQHAPSVMEFSNTESDYRLIKGLTWLNEMFEEYLTLENSALKRGIYLLSYAFVIIVMVMVLFKLFRLKLINKSYSYNVNLDSSNINTQNTTQPNSIMVHVVSDQLSTRQVLLEQNTDEPLQHPRFIIKVNSENKPVTENHKSNSQNGLKRYGFRRWF